MAARSAKAVFVGNIKGGVGKSTLTVYLTEYLRQRFKRQGILLIDTDPQGTSFELLEPRSRTGEARFLPVGDRYDAVNMTTLDGVLRRFLSQDNGIAMVDSGAGKMGNFWQVGFLCNALLVPTSMSWTDLRPTLDFIKEIASILGFPSKLNIFIIFSHSSSEISSVSSILFVKILSGDLIATSSISIPP